MSLHLTMGGKMNLAQALRKLASLRGKISSLQGRIKSDFLVEQGRDSSYTADAYKSMLTDLTATEVEAGTLRAAIDRANHTANQNGNTVASLLNIRKTASDALAFWSDLRQISPNDRYGPDTPKIKRIKDEELDALVDAQTIRRQDLDDQICHLNATIQVI